MVLSTQRVLLVRQLVQFVVRRVPLPGGTAGNGLDVVDYRLSLRAHHERIRRLPVKVTEWFIHEPKDGSVSIALRHVLGRRQNLCDNVKIALQAFVLRLTPRYLRTHPRSLGHTFDPLAQRVGDALRRQVGMTRFAIDFEQVTKA